MLPWKGDQTIDLYNPLETYGIIGWSCDQCISQIFTTLPMIINNSMTWELAFQKSDIISVPVIVEFSDGITLEKKNNIERNHYN